MTDQSAPGSLLGDAGEVRDARLPRDCGSTPAAAIASDAADDDPNTPASAARSILRRCAGCVDHGEDLVSGRRRLGWFVAHDADQPQSRRSARARTPREAPCPRGTSANQASFTLGTP